MPKILYGMFGMSSISQPRLNWERKPCPKQVSNFHDVFWVIFTEHLIESRDLESGDSSVYLCGNSLGLQPKLTAQRIQQYLRTWSTQGVFGHFKPLSESPLPTWLDADVRASESMAPMVGAHPSEVAVMETLTANLHFLMAAFYKPDIRGRHKIILESKAFPSDHVSSAINLPIP